MVGKNPFKMQDRPINFNITEYEKSTDRVLYAILQLTLKKQLFKCGYSIKEECP